MRQSTRELIDKALELLAQAQDQISIDIDIDMSEAVKRDNRAHLLGIELGCVSAARAALELA